MEEKRCLVCCSTKKKINFFPNSSFLYCEQRDSLLWHFDKRGLHEECLKSSTVSTVSTFKVLLRAQKVQIRFLWKFVGCEPLHVEFDAFNGVNLCNGVLGCFL
ncbi:hypothetical protein Ddye_019552 [Dipteronia dyeriana]|uniref:Uncharacterized protein n=1 Tax=Dipteronia dyeriana TaxID=168575 RepID=A0AAD9WVU7_9ROSI|nr:hypothetical protein Ddye_019552 [Dipteronia dyeriana]